MKINKFQIHDVPVTTYEIEDGIKKPLIFFFHGFTGNKDDNIMGRGHILAELGFYVVAVDAYMHGERQTEYYKNLSNNEKYEDIIDVAIHTAQDAKHLFHYYFKNKNEIINDKYYAYGVSMGSLISFYLATIDPTLKAMVGLVCFPSFVEYYEMKQQQLGFEKNLCYRSRLRYYKKIDPLINYKLLSNTKIFMGIGEHDEVVPNIYAKKLHKKLPETILKTYDTGHISTKEMLNDSYNFLKECLK